MIAPVLNIPSVDDVQVNSYTASFQVSPSVATLADGGWVVSWKSDSQDSNNSDIYAQRYDAAGVAVGGEVQVNTTTAGGQGAASQFDPSIAALVDGGFVVSWASSGQDGDGSGICLQRYDGAGVAVGGEVQVNTTTAGRQDEPTIAALVDGGFVVSWESDGQDGDSGGVYLQRYDAAGVAVGGEVQVNTYTAAFQGNPSIAALVDGGFVVSWHSGGQDGDGAGIYLQRYDAAGVAVGGEVQVNTYTAGSQRLPSITALVDGGFVVSWASSGWDGIYLQRYDAAGVAVGGEVQVHTYTSGYQSTPSIAALPSGGFVVSWTSYGQDGYWGGVYLQRYDAAGVAVGGEVQVNTYTAGLQGYPSIAALPSGGFVVSWMSDGQDGDSHGIFQKVFNADGSEWSDAVYVENAPAVAVAPWLAVTDVDSADLAGATITVTDYVAGEDVLSFADQGGITGSWDAATGTLTLTGVATLAAYETALRSVVYANTSDAPTGGNRTIAFQVDDGGATDNLSTPVNAQVTIVPVNDAPIVSIPSVDDVQVNSYTASFQISPSVATLADGGWVVSWQSDSQDGDSGGIYLQRYDAAGVAVGGEVQVNSHTAGFQVNPSIAALVDGGFVVSWQSGGQDGSSVGIYAQRYDAAGVAVGGEVQVNSHAAGFQGNPSITALVDGGFVVSWESDGQDGDWFGVYLQRYDAAGVAVGGEVQVNSHTSGDQFDLSVTALVDGGFVVSWMSDGQDGSGYGIYAQRYDAAGVAVGGEVQVNSHTLGYQGSPSVTALVDGGFVVSWQSGGQDGSGFGIYAQRYDAAGVAVGGEVQVNSHTADFQGNPSITALVDGGFVVSWQSNGQDGDGGGVYLQRYDAAGVAVGGEVQVNTTTAGHQGNPSIAALPSGGFVVSWQSDGQDGGSFGVFQKVFNADGSEWSDAVYMENASAVAVAPGLAVTDVDSADLAGATITVTDYVAGEDVLSFADQGGITGSWDAATGTLTLTGVATLAAYETALRSVAYANTSDAPTGGNRTIAFQVDDGGATDNLSTPVNAQVRIVPVNDAPVLNIPPDIQVNSYTASYQGYPSVATLADGGWVVSWESGGQDGDGSGIYLQRYDAAGVAVGGEVQVNTYTAGFQVYPSVATLADGGWVVSWMSYGQDGDWGGIYLQRYDAAGVAVGGEVQVNTTTAGSQGTPSITALVDGGFVVSWQSDGQDGDGGGVYLQRYDAAGVAVDGEVQVNTYTAGLQGYPSVTALVDGGFVVSWESHGRDGIYLQRYDAAGVAVGGEVQVSTYTAGFQDRPSTTALVDGGFVVSWESYGQDGDSGGIYLQRYDAAGVAVGGEVQVNSHTAGSQDRPSITALPSGGFVVSWESYGQDGDRGGIYLQRYDAAGVAVGGEVQVNTYTAGYQGLLSIAALPSGGFVVSWTSYGQDGDSHGVFQKVFNADGSEWSDAVYVENVPAVAVAPGLAVTDVDSADLAGATITVTDYVAGEDVLSFADQGGIAGSWDAATGTLTLTGVATLAAYETALRSVAYANTSDAPTGGNRTIAFQVDDGGATDNLSTPVNAQVTIVPVNDTPIVSIPSVDDVQVNSYTANRQLVPSVATLADGGWVVSWESGGQDGDSGGVYLQRYDAAGVAVGGEVQVNTTTAGGQGAASIAALVDGGFVVSWMSDGQDGSGFGIYAQRYDAAGVAVGGEVQVNSHTLGYRGFPSITALVDGGFVVSWESSGQDGDWGGVYLQRYDAAGVAVGGEVQVNTYTAGHQFAASIAALVDGGFVVSWQSDGQDGSSYGTYLQRYDAAGVAVGGEVQVNSHTASFQGYPSVTALVDGGFVVSWESDGQDGDWFGVYLQRYDAAGVAVGGEVQVNSHTARSQGNPSITALVDGGFVVSWQSSSQDGDGSGVYLQRYDAAGVAVGGEVQVNTYTAGLQGYPSVTALPSGGFVVSWTSQGQDGDSYGVFQKVFNADGSEWSDAVYMENASAVAVAPGLAVTDVDSADLAGATIAVTDYVAGEDVLSFADQGGIAGSWDAATGTLTLTGVATLAAYETALRSVAYANTSDAPTGGNRTIAFQVDDGGATDNLSAPVNAQVTIVAVADPGEIVGAPGVNDVLNATAGHDMFIFKPGFGHDTVTGFQSGAGTDDVIQLENMGYTDLAGVLADTQQVGADAVITVDASNSITLVGIDVANLHDDDFRYFV